MRGLPAASLVVAMGVAGCSIAPPSPPVFPDGMTIECGPVAEAALCENAVAVALTAQLNPVPAAAVEIRLPRKDDDCRTWFHACGAGAVMAVIQSGDTLQDVPLIRTADGWVRLDLVR